MGFSLKAAIIVRKEFFMKKEWRMVLCAVITMLVLSTFPLAAQIETAQTSRTSEATAGLFGTEVDDFLSYHYYEGVEFDKFFSYAGWRALNGTDRLSAGYARRFGGIYAALAYTGNIVSNSNVTSTKTNTATYDINGVNTQTVTSESGMNTTASPRNQIDLLLGIAGMGIKVGFAEDLTVVDSPAGTSVSPINQITDYPGSAYAEHRNIVDTYRNVSGLLAPYLGWGMNLTAAGLTIRPYANVGLAVHLDERLDIRKNFNTLGGAAVGEQISVINSDINYESYYESYFEPEIALGADLVLKDDGTVEIDAGLEYGIGFQAYNNAFDVFGVSGSTPGKVDSLTGTYRITEGTYGAQEYQNVAAGLTEETYVNQKITPSVTYYQKLADNVKIGFNLAPGFELTTSKTLAWTETTTKNYTYPAYQGANRASTVTTAVTGKAETGVTTFVFTPVISGGVTYTVIPNRFVLNAGLTAEISYTGVTTVTKPAGYGRSVTTTTDADGNETQSITSIPTGTLSGTDAQVDSVATRSYWSGLSTTASGGFTLYFTPKFALDTAFSFTGGDYIDLYQVALLFSLKN
jgi:hypothetical protein